MYILYCLNNLIFVLKEYNRLANICKTVPSKNRTQFFQEELIKCPFPSKTKSIFGSRFQESLVIEKCKSFDNKYVYEFSIKISKNFLAFSKISPP